VARRSRAIVKLLAQSAGGSSTEVIDETLIICIFYSKYTLSFSSPWLAFSAPDRSLSSPARSVHDPDPLHCGLQARLVKSGAIALRYSRWREYRPKIPDKIIYDRLIAGCRNGGFVQDFPNQGRFNRRCLDRF
jgi:hypothetical protein